MSASNLPLTLSEAVLEAESITAEAASAAFVDRKRREFEAAVDEHLMRWGFDFPEAVQS